MQDHHSTNESFDIIVIGGGHAGCEAAITTAKLGFLLAVKKKLSIALSKTPNP